MPNILRRLKPDPIPAIRAVPEYAATGRLAQVYDRTKQGFGVPWMGVVTMAFARYPTFYDCLWAGLEPVISIKAFRAACDTLRSTAEGEADRLGPQNVLRPLQDIGYDSREIDDIRACNEAFSAGNMPYLLIASLARHMLEGHEWHGQGDLVSNDEMPAHPRPVLIEQHHADPETQSVYDDIRATLGLPFVNTDYRAFARWPSYFGMAWGDLKKTIQSSGYEEAVTRVHETALRLATGLPNETGLTAQHLQQAAGRDADLSEVRDVVRLFQWLLPGLVTNVAFLRGQLSGPD